MHKTEFQTYVLIAAALVSGISLLMFVPGWRKRNTRRLEQSLLDAASSALAPSTYRSPPRKRSGERGRRGGSSSSSAGYIGGFDGSSGSSGGSSCGGGGSSCGGGGGGD